VWDLDFADVTIDYFVKITPLPWCIMPGFLNINQNHFEVHVVASEDLRMVFERKLKGELHGYANT